MLTFTRKPGQMIRIGDSIRVTVKQVRGRQVRLAIEAPRSFSIFREELYEQIVAENARAALVDPDVLELLK